jgi:DNA polymerase alpha subunit A
MMALANMSITEWMTGARVASTIPQRRIHGGSVRVHANLYSCRHLIIIHFSAKKKSAAAKPKGQYSDYVKAKPKAPPTEESRGMSAYMPSVSKEQETDFMASLLGDINSVPLAPVPRKTRKRKDYLKGSDDEGMSSGPSRGYRNGRSAYRDADSSSDGYEGYEPEPPSNDDFDQFQSPRKKVRTGAALGAAVAKLGIKSDGEDSSDAADVDASFDGIDMDAFMEVDDDDLSVLGNAKRNGKGPGVVVKKEESDVKPFKSANEPVAKKKETEEVPSWLAVYDSLKVSADSDAALGSGSKTVAAGSTVDALEEDGSLRFFWLDYLEHEGKLYFVGKVRDKKSDAWASACITVEGLQRNLFVLPRERRVEERYMSDEDSEEDEEDDEISEDERERRQARKEEKRKERRKKGMQLVETDEVPEMTEVYADFDQVRRKAGIKKWKGKFVKRRYAFGEKDVPREERMWLKVVYGFDGAHRPRSLMLALT